ncbi:hypothetical protein ACJZ2D_015120 [Fusarium nematophilum]
MDSPSLSLDHAPTACQACRKAKIGCDRAIPQCARCARTDVACEYRPRKKRAANVPPTAQPQNSEPPVLRPDEATSTSFVNRHVSCSGNGKTHHRTKRDRAVLSCARCRRHKVRCDRKVPCSRCIKSKRESQCIYNYHEAPQIQSQSTEHITNGTLGPPPTRFVDTSWESNLRNGTHWRKVVDELKSQVPPCQQLGSGFNVLSEPFCIRHVSVNFPFSNGRSSDETVQRILGQLPPRPVQEEFISLYIETIEKSFHVLDEAAWKQELQDFWKDISNSSDDWLAQLLMILSLGCQAYNFASEDSPYLNLPFRFMDAAHTMLARTPYMVKCSLANIRTLCLIVISKQVYVLSCHDSDTCWPLTGLIKRLSIRAGLHAPQGEPNEVWAVRRIWALVIYLDMRQALVSGMPVLMRQDDIACFSCDIGSSSSTPSSYFYDNAISLSESDGPLPTALEKTFEVSGVVLLSALEFATASGHTASYDEVVKLDVEIRSRLGQSGMGLVTENLGTDECPESIDWEASTIHLFFRLILMALHSPFAMQPNAPTDYPVSYVSSLESALAILSHQRSLHSCGRQSTWFANLFRHEFFTAAMVVCSQLLREGHQLDLPPPQVCEGQAQEIILDALESCRDIWERERDASTCNANAFALLNYLVSVLQAIREETHHR